MTKKITSQTQGLVSIIKPNSYIYKFPADLLTRGLMMKKFVLRVLTGVLLTIIINLTFLSLLPHLPVQGAVNNYKIMPLGGSSTAGVPDGGGFRIKLWNTAQAKHWNINFVGSQSNGPKSLGDKNHEGHPGYRIDQIASLVDRALATYKPQIILLYTGTNDAVQNHDINNAHVRLKSLIDQIFHDLPKVHLLVGNLGLSTNDKFNAGIKKINEGIPNIVRIEQAHGHSIKLVDMNSVLTKDDILPDKIHPKHQGYDKMADQWAKAIQPLLK